MFRPFRYGIRCFGISNSPAGAIILLADMIFDCGSATTARLPITRPMAVQWCEGEEEEALEVKSAPESV
ncbi:MAG: hypothetical protein QOF90_129 [Acetobacteraceae bacterium]|jgi:hypothetical protein|nr:hypothetical protein [Acetobacteraceae bacterium]